MATILQREDLDQLWHSEKPVEQVVAIIIESYVALLEQIAALEEVVGRRQLNENEVLRREQWLRTNTCITSEFIRHNLEKHGHAVRKREQMLSTSRAWLAAWERIAALATVEPS